MPNYARQFSNIHLHITKATIRKHLKTEFDTVSNFGFYKFYQTSNKVEEEEEKEFISPTRIISDWLNVITGIDDNN